MADDYVPRSTNTNTGWTVGLLVLLLLIPLLLCGIGLIGFGGLYTSVEVQRPAPIIEAPAAVPAEVQTPEEPPVETEAK